ncbi:MAG: hypothetical protein HGA53_00425, partial [Anaerolineaceae bacterium]|nr:hypothetical protein [Anaerolineaceae bacterium]
EDERQKVLATANQQAEEQIIDLRKELEDLRKALTRARQPIEALKPLQDQVDTLQEQIEQPVERINENMSISRPIKVGDKVKLRSLNMGGVVVSMGLDGAEVRVGNLRIRAKLDDILPHGTVEDTRTVTPSIPSKKQTPASPAAASRSIFHTSPGMELDLRGQRAEDALEALDRYLENAFLAGMPFVRIIHGKGTGKLRQVIREALQQSPHISRFETGHEKEGGDGVTVAHLRTD